MNIDGPAFLAVFEVLAILFGATAIVVSGGALVTICAIFWKRRTLARHGDDPLPNLPRNRAERRIVMRVIRRERALARAPRRA